MDKKTIGPDALEETAVVEGLSRYKISWETVNGLRYYVFRSPEKLDLPLLENGQFFEIGDQLPETELTLLYKGTLGTFIDDGLIQNQNYYYYIYAADELGNFSLPYEESLISFGTPFSWIASGQAASMYRGAIQGGTQTDAIGANIPLFICRADFGSGQMVPGQLEAGSNLGDGVCRSVGFGADGLEATPQTNYEILVSTREDFDEYFAWSNIIYSATVAQQIPALSITAGIENNAPLYICRGSFANRFYPGKIGTTYDRCSAPAYNGATFDFPAFNSWQVLTVKARDPILE